jgi:prepilin-type N-terminal cleavage/methylation domain-containing protein
MRKQRGFTLLEMLISIGIFVLVATASSVVFNQAIRAYSYTTSRMAAAREAELAMEWIVRDIRPDDSGNVLDIVTGVPTSDNDEITLNPPAPAPADRIHYYRLPDPANPGFFTIQKQMFDQGAQYLLARNVLNLRFTYFNAQNQDVTAFNPSGAVCVEIIIETQVNNQNFRLYNVACR